ncbi:MAG: esterase/lipase family protein [Candidatus Binatia bacterium]
MIKTTFKPFYSAHREAKAPNSLGNDEPAESQSSNDFCPAADDLARSPELPPGLQAPRRSGLIREAYGLLELPRLVLRFPALARERRGRGEPVLVLPGYGCGNVSTVVLQSYLRFLGYGVRGCGRGIYAGEVGNLLRRVLKRLMTMAYKSRQQVSIIGWSLGGYLAREAARERPELVHRVITLGTPVIGGPKYTVVAEVFRRRGIDVEAIALQVDERNKISFATPVTAIYSRVDAVVAWEACIDRNGLNIEHIEVATTHVGLGFSPEVYQIIAQRLANGPGPVKPETSNNPIESPRRKRRRSQRR